MRGRMAYLRCECGFVKDNIPDAHVGKKAKCPKCRESVPIKEKETDKPSLKNQIESTSQHKDFVEDQNYETVKCPSCGLAFLAESRHYIENPEIKSESNKEIKHIPVSEEKSLSRDSITFPDSIKICFSKFIDFNGRASRSEFWWFMLFVVVVGTILSFVNIALSLLFYLVVFLPSLSAGARRLHDTDRSGWFLLISPIPLVNLLLLYFLIQEPKEPNRFGSTVPMASVAKTDAFTTEPEKRQIQSTTAKVSTGGKNWTMQTKPTAYWKFLLGANLFKKYQLDKIERTGDTIYVRVLSGNEQHFEIEDLNAKFNKTKHGLRDFILKSVSEPKRKITFRETQLQMPEEWWDKLSKRIGVSESGLSRVLHAATNALEE